MAMSRAARVALLLAAACGRAEPPAAGGPGSAGSAAAGSASVASAGSAAPADAGSAAACTPLAFADSTPLPEASGAAWLTIDGALALVAISDSGNDGAYAIIDPESGATREQGQLPLGGGGDDLEGLAARAGKLYAISSPGWIRVYRRSGAGFALADGPYPLGPVDLDDQGGGNQPPKDTGMVCASRRVNCGRNYEGLCLAPGPVSGPCVGFAAAKADGHLYCVVERDGKLQVDRAASIEVARPGALSDCAFSEDGRLYAGTNLFDAGNVYRITGWEDPARAQVARIAPLLIGFPEALAVRGDVIYRMSDAGGAPSFMKKFRCPGR